MSADMVVVRLSMLLLLLVMSLCFECTTSVKIKRCSALPSLKNGQVRVEKYNGLQSAEFTCRHGYELVGMKWAKCSENGKWSPQRQPICRDIDECKLDATEHPCSMHADCINLDGEYKCICRPGFNGNGKKCIPSIENFLRFGDTCGTVSIKNFNDSARYRRIVGGRQAVPGGWPWQVMLHLRKKGIPFAGGALVDKRWVVTLASVLHSGAARLAPSDIKIVLGDYDRRKSDFQEVQYNVKRVIMYPGFDRMTLDKDIALVELDREVKLGTYVNKVCLVSGRKSKTFVKSSRIATISGWGTTRAVRIGGKPGDFSDVLQEVNLPLVASKKCQLATSYNFNPRSQICAGFYADQKSPCYGDAGSPLVTQDPDSGRWVLIGLFSWSEGCGQKHKFSYYTRVAKFRRWIVYTIKNS